MLDPKIIDDISVRLEELRRDNPNLEGQYCALGVVHRHYCNLEEAVEKGDPAGDAALSLVCAALRMVLGEHLGSMQSVGVSNG